MKRLLVKNIGRIVGIQPEGRLRVWGAEMCALKTLECALPPAASGVIGPTPGVVGALEAAEAIKWLVGFGEPLDGRLLTLDLKTMQTETIEF